jgi:four helix bundle suffix protein
MADDRSFLPAHGNYRDLIAYQKAIVIYDLTVGFCHRFLKTGDRTIDQMVQAARSGKQNILEGSKASVTSSETELKLTNVARSSLEELLADYQDFLRANRCVLWDKTSREAIYVRKLGKNPNLAYSDIREICETRPPEIVANFAICLIHQTNYLLDRLLRRLQRDFLQNGGIREQMGKARQKYKTTHGDGL